MNTVNIGKLNFYFMISWLGMNTEIPDEGICVEMSIRYAEFLRALSKILYEFPVTEQSRMVHTAERLFGALRRGDVTVVIDESVDLYRVLSSRGEMFLTLCEDLESIVVVFTHHRMRTLGENIRSPQ